MARTFSVIIGVAAALVSLPTAPALARPTAVAASTSSAASTPVPSPHARALGVEYGHGAPMGWERAGAQSAPSGTVTTAPVRTTRQASTFAAASSSAAPQYGIDVSNYQGTVNWSSYKTSGVSFAFIKATEGTYYKSSTFNSQYSGATTAGLIRSSYHFAIPNDSGGAAQADYFVHNGGNWSADGVTLPGVLDIEYDPYTSSDGTNSCYGMSPSQMVAWIKDFSSRYLADTGVYPTIYSTTGWWKTCTGNSSAFAATNPFWLASYTGSKTSGPGALPAGVSSWTFWQYGDGASPYNFCGTNYDCDQFNGTLAQLQQVATTPFFAPTTNIGVGQVAGAQQIYLVNAAGRLITQWQTSPGGYWTTWQDWGGGYTPGTPIGVGEVAGVQQIYLVNAAGHLITQWQTSPGGHWSTWQDWGGGYTPGTPIGVGHAPNGAQEIYLVNAAGHLTTMWQSSPGGSWTPWLDWGGGYAPTTPVGVGIGANGAQQIYLVTAAGHLVTRWQTSPGGHWSAWVDWGTGYTPRTPIGVGIAANLAQQIYLVNAAGHLVTQWQTSPGGYWSSWQDWGGGYSPATPIGVGASNGLQQIYLTTGAAGHLATTWQMTPNGSWTTLRPWMN